MRIFLMALPSIAAAVLSGPAAFAEPRPQLCASSEEAVFTCRTRTKKIISLCASPAIGTGDVSLRYLFGTSSKTELHYPAAGVSTRAAFARGVTGGTAGGADFLRFAIAGATYTLFSDHYRGRERDGIVVERGGKRIAVLICQANAVSTDKGWATLYRANLPVLPPDFEPP